MRLFLIMDETSFYHPGFVHDLLEQTQIRDEVVGAAVVVDIPNANSLDHHLMKNWYRLRPMEMAQLAFQKYSALAKDALTRPKRGGPCFSVASVLTVWGVPWFPVRRNINRAEYLNRIRDSTPDVIISSNSLIFKNELLKIPAFGCLNRHSALLPSYGGLWPVLQAYRAGEQETGVSVHVMEPEIDKGPVLAQRAVPMRNEDTLMTLYKACFSISASVVCDALEKVRVGDYKPVATTTVPSYFSFPKPEQWRQFRERGGRFV